MVQEVLRGGVLRVLPSTMMKVNTTRRSTGGREEGDTLRGSWKEDYQNRRELLQTDFN